MEKFDELVPNFDVTVLSNDSDDDEIYEKIEAPKFVDLTAPDKSLQVDDRSWFCLRVGCDLKHEEEMDPETIYKQFVLRVMAARSPNFRFRKTLSRQASANMKCPLSAPAKSSKRRMSRLTVVTSLSQKLADAKVKVHPLCKLNSTPKEKAKKSSVAAKALTTPRNKKCLPSQDPFRSVQNPKAKPAIPRNRRVAKSLFGSPKKAVESQTPGTDICSGMKKLEINDQSNQPCELAGCTPRGPDKRVTASAEPLESKLRNQTSKNRTKLSRDHKGKPKSLRRSKSKSKGNLRKSITVSPEHGPIDDFSDMEIDEKSRKGSINVCSVLGNTKTIEEHMIAVEEDNTIDIMQPVPSTEKDSEEKDCHKSETSELEMERSNEEIQPKDMMKSNLGELILEEKVYPISHPSSRKGCRKEPTEIDDKENASTSANNRELNLNDENVRKNISENDFPEKHQKGPTGKTVKGSCAVTATGSLGGKYKKTKPTNPKPFRLRTDERGILREAKLEKKLLAPLREIATAAKNSDADSQRKQGNEMERNEKSSVECRHENDHREGNQMETSKRIQKIQTRQVKSKYLETSKYPSAPKRVTTTTILRQKKLEDIKEKASLALSSRRTINQSQLPQQQLGRPQRMVVTRKITQSLIPQCKLSVIKETSAATISRPKEAKLEKGGTIVANAPGRSTSRGRRPGTVPKEPHFHGNPTPTNCTKTPTKVIS